MREEIIPADDRDLTVTLELSWMLNNLIGLKLYAVTSWQPQPFRLWIRTGFSVLNTGDKQTFVHQQEHQDLHPEVHGPVFQGVSLSRTKVG